MENENAIRHITTKHQTNGYKYSLPHVINVFLKNCRLIELLKSIALLTENFKCDIICKDLKYRISAMNRCL